MARKLSIWPFPRGHHHALTRLPIKGATLLLADQRFCPLLPDQHRLKPMAGLRAVAGALHESCSAACRLVITPILVVSFGCLACVLIDYTLTLH